MTPCRFDCQSRSHSRQIIATSNRCRYQSRRCRPGIGVHFPARVHVARETRRRGLPSLVCRIARRRESPISQGQACQGRRKRRPPEDRHRRSRQCADPPLAEAPLRPGVLPEAVAMPSWHRGLRHLASLVAPAQGARPYGAADAASLCGKPLGAAVAEADGTLPACGAPHSVKGPGSMSAIPSGHCLGSNSRPLFTQSRHFLVGESPNRTTACAKI